MSLSIDWRNSKEVAAFQSALSRLDRAGFETVAVRVLNRVGDMAHRGKGPSVVKTLAKTTSLPQKVVRKRVWVKRATPYGLEFHIIARHGDVGLKYFKARETLRGVSVLLNGSREVLPNTFIRGGRFPNRVDLGMNGHVFEVSVPVSQWGRGFEKARSGVDLAVELQRGDTLKGFESIVSKNLPKRTDHEIRRLLGL